MSMTTLLEKVANYKQYRLSTLPPVKAKVAAIRHELLVSGISDVVVGVSGGVDSAVVLGLLAATNCVKIHAVNIKYDLYDEVYDSSYVDELKAFHAARGSDIEWHEIDLTEQFNSFMHGVCSLPSYDVDANVSYAMRYLAFFAIAQEVKGVTFGTTNLDEMGYVGWFGKTSDMVVDFQPIADLHKYEVRKYAGELNVPARIIHRSPAGDLLDNSSDEENFQCTYDELAYITRMYLDGIPFTDEIHNKYFRVIELHHKNQHKYRGQTFNPIFIKF